MLTSAKRDLRSRVRKVLSGVTSGSLHGQSTVVCRTLLESEQFRSAKSVGVYMNMPTMEVQTESIIKACFDQQKAVFLPKCSSNARCEGRKKNYMSMIHVPSLGDVHNLEPQGKYRLLEPTEGTEVFNTAGLDLLILPGMAFTKSGRRLGHGAGFYDEFLTVYQSHFARVPYLVGLALSEQIVDDIPHEEHDWDLDCIISQEGQVFCRKINHSLH
ncbi:hypothetical protein PGUG_05584 [Meyerozyma guilliermondii ATCC 6260]|uniref:5-formyltetrahydrofolate cyclo-ligase n=1 Tax=Meyerozyma guilliermondii (strain ATCC 6260 / CBS 566 / DSM 6381 / JCM 1539 / NBRC 10279 / NRRL Y-324) TaxID=294746 RepID=A5DQN3_PICGU|nr:uncharacterized protein PGUG_05584 [Meyerozyma guilliermondii ATCC 6260]EDK41486.2 hypothetical protein PGUG_05584 [Meyerozyma guilliermondii ATCC 6260]